MKKVKKLIQFDKDLVIEFEKIAKEEGLLFTHAVRQAMMHYMKSKKS